MKRKRAFGAEQRAKLIEELQMKSAQEYIQKKSKRDEILAIELLAKKHKIE